MDLIGKFRATAGELGWINAFLYGLNRMTAKDDKPVICKYYLVGQPVAEKPLLPASRGRSIIVRLLPPGAPELQSMPLTADVLDFRYRQQAICFGAFKGEAMIGCLWLCLGPYNEDEVRCRFLPGPDGQACWDFDAYLLPEHRTGLGFARLWDEANAYLRARDFRWSISRISAFNPNSLASHKRLGARHLASALYVRLGRWQLLFATVAPYIHLSTGPTKAPTLRLSAQG